MDSSLFRHILTHITKQIPCPQCGETFHGKSFRVVDIAKEGCVFLVDCPICNAELKVKADIQLKKEKIKQKMMSPDTVRGIGESLQNFYGEDVKQLFS